MVAFWMRTSIELVGDASSVAVPRRSTGVVPLFGIDAIAEASSFCSRSDIDAEVVPEMLDRTPPNETKPPEVVLAFFRVSRPAPWQGAQERRAFVQGERARGRVRPSYA